MASPTRRGSTKLLLAAAVLVVLAVILAPTPATSAEAEDVSAVLCRDLVPSECTQISSPPLVQVETTSSTPIRRPLHQKCCESLVNNVEDRCFCDVTRIFEKKGFFDGLSVPSACGKLQVEAKSKCTAS
jgi:hypothetical protein